MAEIWRRLREVLIYWRAMVIALVTTRHTLVMLSTIILLMLWGRHGEVELLRAVLPGWTGPGSAGAPGRAQLIPGMPWDQEWISFGIGALLLVLVPCLIIRLGFKERLADYGLAGPKRGQWPFTLAGTCLLSLFAYPSMYGAAGFASMRQVYPLCRNLRSLSEFALFELGYFVFFLVIEFVFRGYLLLGLFGAHHPQGARGVREDTDPALLSHYSVVVSMLSYTAWHLGKPLPELWSTPIWGVLAGALVLRSGTIWPVVLVHWSMNVLFDYVIWSS